MLFNLINYIQKRVCNHDYFLITSDYILSKLLTVLHKINYKEMNSAYETEICIFMLQEPRKDLSIFKQSHNEHAKVQII